MEIFVKEEYIKKNTEEFEFFHSWYKAIYHDFNIFKIILENYTESRDKTNLLTVLSYIQHNILNEIEDEYKLVMSSTPNYYLFSFYNKISEIPNYVLLSKDYKRFIISTEEMECFDDPNFDENERYGIYTYDYFFLKDNQIKHYHEEKKEYTTDFNSQFTHLRLISNIRELENYYNSLFTLRKKK